MTPNAKRPIPVDDAYSNEQALKVPKVGIVHSEFLLDAAARSTRQTDGRVDSFPNEAGASSSTTTSYFAKTKGDDTQMGVGTHGPNALNTTASNDTATEESAADLGDLPLGDLPLEAPKSTFPKLTKQSRVRPSAVKDDMRHIRVPAGSERPSAAREKLIRAFKKADKGRYRYSPIRADQVRLLIIKPGNDDEDDINGTLQVVDDNDLGTEGYSFEALSYHWGEGEDMHTIIIQDDYTAKPIKKMADAVFGIMTAEGLRSKRLYVRPNLYEALKRLRAPDRPVALWVDALCINQLDEPEKTSQVLKMDKIYHKAFNVCIWLGSDDQDYHSYQAMNFIKEVIDQKKLGNLLTDDNRIPQWASLFQLLKWSWFSRRWVIQELALAQEATVHCGKLQVHWNDFRDAIAIFHRYFNSLRPRLQDPKLGGRLISDLEPLGAKLLVEITSNLFRRKPDGSHESTMGLEKLVSLLASFSTSDPRDTINCLRNISRELNSVKTSKMQPSRPLPPSPDYTKDLYEVYRDFISWVVEDSGSLDIICRHWALQENPKPIEFGPTAAPRLVKLPSWILIADDGSFGAGETVFKGRKAGDSFVGLPGERCYSASGRRLATVEFGKTGTSATRSVQLDTPLTVDNITHDMSLSVHGFLIGIVDWSSDPIPDGVIPQRGLERLGWTPEYARASEVAPDQLCRTLVADRGPNGTRVPTYYPRACLYCLLNETANGHINTKELLQADDFRDQPSIVQDYLERVLAVTWNRVIFQGSPPPETPDSLGGWNSDKVVGLGPPRTQQGDVIAIFFGCSVPVILRPSPGATSPEYEFIGEAYVYGKMDGEAMFESHSEKIFKLR